ncbi:MAG: NCS2 family permease [Deltaproteobacteria bacterium]|jgi:AGZA family xanthine/uracil permease-like MFS transporter|nr:NCS2 family permease [Deltaproteobacteria bacterium]
MFDLAKHNASPLVEISAGLTTFFSMVYVLAANPAILSQAGISPSLLFTATAVSVVVATLIMAFVANLPFAVAPGMGLNAFFVVIVTQMGFTVSQALTAVLLSGGIFVLLSVSPLREIVLREVPKCLQHGVCAGIGLMIGYIGLMQSGVVVFNIDPLPAAAGLAPKGSVAVGLGNLTGGAGLLVVLGLVITGVMLALKIRFAILLGIIATTAIGVPLGATQTSALAGGFVSLPPDSSELLFNFDFSVLRSFEFWSIVLTLLFMEVVDGLAGFLGLFGVMGADGERYRPKMSKAFIADSIGVAAGAALGVSPNTTYAESGSGVASGGRTGLTALVVAICFFLALFISPLFMIIPFSAVAPALIMVGLLMLRSIAKVNFEDYTEIFPAFVVLIVVALSWRISDGLSLGWILYIIMKVVSGKRKQLTTTVWVVGLIFAFKMFVAGGGH